MTRRRALAVAGAVMLLLGGGAGWWWQGLQHDARDGLARAAPVVPSAHAAAASAPGASPMVAAAWLAPQALTGVSTETSAAAAVPASAADASGDGFVMDICGLGAVNIKEARGWNPVQLMKAKAAADALEQREDAELNRISARLAAGGPAERVAARLVKGDVEGAAALALGAHDAAAYRLAWLACRVQAEPTSVPSCRGLNTQTWARLDPQDADPWLFAVGEALQAGDEAAAAAASEQALQRSKRGIDKPLQRLAGAAAGDGGDAIGLGMAFVEILGVEFALVDTSTLGVGRYCGREALKDAGRRASCQRHARWQLTHARNLLDLQLALGLAQRAGVPDAELPYTREAVTRAAERLRQESISALDASCHGLARFADHARRGFERNELTLLDKRPASGG